MNKIIRIASVFALACAALLYTGCTKDFSEDIARLEDQKATKADVAAVNEALNAYKQEANAAIDAIKAELPNKANVADLNALKTRVDGIETIANTNKADIAALQTKVGTVETQLQGFIAQAETELTGLKDKDTELAQAIADVKTAYEAGDAALQAKIAKLDSLNDVAHAAIKVAYEAADAALQAKIDTLETRATALEERADDLEEAVAKLQAQMGDVLAMVQSITFVPGFYNHEVFGKADVAGLHDHNWKVEIDTVETIYEYKWTDQWAAFWKDILPAGWAKRIDVDTFSFSFPAVWYDYSWKSGIDGKHEHAIAGTEVADAIAYDYILPEGEVSNPVFTATFQVTPKAAAKNITKEDLKLRVVAQTKAWAADPVDTLIDVTYVKARENGYIDIIAAFQKPASMGKGIRFKTGADVMLIYSNTTKNGVTAEVACAPINVVTAAAVTGYQQDSNSVTTWNIPSGYLTYVIADANAKKDENPIIDTVYCDPVLVTPATADPKKAIFEPGRFQVWAAVWIDDVVAAPLDTIAALMGYESGKDIKPAVGDTVIQWHRYLNPKQFANDNNGLNTKVFPAEGYDVTKIYQDVIDYKCRPYVISNVGIKNSQKPAEAAEKAYAACRVFGSYVVGPEFDTTSQFLANPDDILWDWRRATTPLAEVADTVKLPVVDADSLVTFEGNNFRNYEAAENYFVKIYNKTTGTVKNSYGSYIYKINSNKVAAVIKSSDIEYGKADSTYVFEVSRFDYKRAKVYVSAFEFVVKARPADFEIVCAPVDTVLDSFENDVVIANDFAKQFISKFSVKTVKADTTAFNTKADAAVDTTSLQTIGYLPAKTTIAKASLKYGTGDIKCVYKIFGINVTVKQTWTVSKPNAKLAKIGSYLNGENGVYDTEIVGYADASTGYVYTLKVLPFSQYMKVEANKAYSLHADIKKVTPVATGADSYVIPTAPIALKENDTTYFTAGADTIKWGADVKTYFKDTTFTVKAVLDNKSNVALDSATIKLWTIDPIKSFEGGSVEVTEKFNTATTCNIFSKMSVIDYKDVELVKQEEKRLHTAGNVWFTEYDQKVTVKTSELKCINSEIKDLKVTIDEEGNFKLDQNQATLTGDLVFTVPVELTYCLGKKESIATITVKAAKAE